MKNTLYSQMNGKDEILGEYLNLNLKKLDTLQFYTKKTQNDPQKR